MAERKTRIWASQIAEIKPSDAKATNSPTDNQIPKKTVGEDKFTWVDTHDPETASTIATIITGAGVIAEPLDADEFPFYKIVGTILKKVTWVNIKATLKTYFDTLYQAIGTYLSNLVEDTTPQLGGDLDLNGKNIDFPTTANISDCLDEDNMASDSATKLATQQSIKAYADTKGDMKYADLRFKIITATRDMTTASNDVAYSGVGFVPKAIIVFACGETLTAASWGFLDGTRNQAIADYSAAGAGANVWTSGGAYGIILVTTAGGINQLASLKSFDADGFTLTWTKAGTPTGTAYMRFMCFR